MIKIMTKIPFTLKTI